LFTKAISGLLLEYGNENVGAGAPSFPEHCCKFVSCGINHERGLPRGSDVNQAFVEKSYLYLYYNLNNLEFIEHSLGFCSSP
ncbi:MAG: hypothetical protein PHI32_07050, partial [Dysgonamonadaceae bacterium]|nr:hypothetical protein [Dysgonamonadaceae bacterium]